MVSLPELQFAVKYPFTETAKRVMQEMDVPLEKVSAEIKNLATQRIIQAFHRKKPIHSPIQHQEILSNQLISYPVVKLTLASLQDYSLSERFAQTMADSVFESLEQEQNKEEIFKKIARDFHFDFQSLSSNRYSLSLPNFLSANPLQPSLRLVNQIVSQGKVYLSTHMLARWISALAYQHVLDSLKSKPKKLPSELETFIAETEIQIQELRQKSVQASDFSLEGQSVHLDLFPDCMRSLYLRLSNGENLPHMARFFLASFLVAVQMPTEEIIELFRKAPNFDEKTTRYHLQNIERKKYSPPSSAKLREHGLACTGCGVAHHHPVTYYKKELAKLKGKTKTAEAQSQAEKEPAPESQGTKRKNT